jgi:pyruvate,orthophosphate dikinase
VSRAGATEAHLIGGGTPAGPLEAAAVGGKAANLTRLHRLGLAVPPALALTTELAVEYFDRGALPDGFRTRLAESIRDLETAARLTLGGDGPLIVSVRSSPPSSMPGMLGTVLNVGMSEEAVGALIRRTGNPWLAWDAYRRFVRSFGEAVCGCAAGPFEALADAHLASAGVTTIQDLDPIALRELARASAALVPAIAPAHTLLPADPLAQIEAAVQAVLRSWTSPWAREYRRMNGLDDGTGTGVLIQAMVFGNSGPRSGSGVGFTRNPADGAPEMYVDFVFNAQGEDVVSGRLPVAARNRLPAALPDVWARLYAARPILEREFQDMQDIEFTVEDGRLFFLQARPGKRTPWAALRIATDLVREGIIGEAVAIERLAPYDLQAIARVVVRAGPGDRPIGRATPASVGVASGAVVFDAARAQALGAARPVILVRSDLATGDIAGLAAAAGVLTRFGGRTSHAAVVARQLGKVCLVGCAELRVDAAARTCTLGDARLREGDAITLDGETGLIYAGSMPIATERPDDDLALVARWRARDASPEIRQERVEGSPIR